MRLHPNENFFICFNYKIKTKYDFKNYLFSKNLVIRKCFFFNCHNNVDLKVDSM